MIAKYLEDLVAGGMTEAQIAAAIGRNQSSVNRMRKGQRTDYDTGVKIEQLHREKCPDQPPPQIEPEQGRAAA